MKRLRWRDAAHDGPDWSRSDWTRHARRVRRLALAQFAIMVSIGLTAVAASAGIGRSIVQVGASQRTQEAQLQALLDAQDEIEKASVTLDAALHDTRATASTHLETVGRQYAAALTKLRVVNAEGNEASSGKQATLFLGDGLVSLIRDAARAKATVAADVVRTIEQADQGVADELGAWVRLDKAALETRKEKASLITRLLEFTQIVTLVLLTVAGALVWRRLERARHRLDVEVANSEQRFRHMIQQSSDLVLVVDRGGAITFTSDAVDRSVGRSVVGRQLFEIVHPDDSEAVEQLWARAVAGKDGGDCNVRLRAGDGHAVHIEFRSQNLLDDASVSGLVLNGRDVSDRKAVEEALAHRSSHDARTELPNRLRFEEVTSTALFGVTDERRPVVFAVGMPDLTTLNASLGRGAGDRLLRETSTRLRDTLGGATAELALIDDGEFGVLLEDGGSDDDLLELARRMHDAVSQPLDVGVEIRPSVGIGVAVAAPGATAESLLRDADNAVRVALSGQGSGVHVFSAEDVRMTRRRLTLRAALERAAENGELFLDYQPIVDLDTLRVEGAEALVRWRHPERGIVSPAEFIPIAEETVLIDQIGAWSLSEACRGAAAWTSASGPAPYVSANVSPRTMASDRLLPTVIAALDESGLPAERLVLEITEGSIFHDLTTAERRLRELEALGVRIAIDDFGTGYASLANLARLPLHILKVDRSFITQLGSGATGKLAATVVRVGDVLHLKTIAEGVERADQVIALRELGCPLGQGYLFSRPVTPDVIAAAAARSDGRILPPLPREPDARGIDYAPESAAPGDDASSLRAAS